MDARVPPGGSGLEAVARRPRRACRSSPVQTTRIGVRPPFPDDVAGRLGHLRDIAARDPRCGRRSSLIVVARSRKLRDALVADRGGSASRRRHSGARARSASAIGRRSRGERRSQAVPIAVVATTSAKPASVIRQSHAEGHERHGVMTARTPRSGKRRARRSRLRAFPAAGRETTKAIESLRLLLAISGLSSCQCR